MNRHHPYSYEGGNRRGGSPQASGADRYHRYSDRGGPPGRGRGSGRGGRGGYGPSANSYDVNGYSGGYGAPSYDQPPQSDFGAPAPYGSYDNDSYYGYGNAGGPSTGYPPPSAPPIPGPPMSGNFDPGYGQFEDSGAGGYDDFGRGPAGGGRGGRIPREKAIVTKVPDSVIEQRIQRERPCRTLFIRNIKYETNSTEVRRMFEDFGDIKTFFDLISTRGMVFVTFYDLRAAERARERLQGSEISGRPIDVHYSLPKDDKNGEQERNVGSLQVTLVQSPSGQPIDDNELRRKFQQFGDVKAVKPVGDRHDSRFVEFYDTRACDDSFDRLRHQGLQDGVMDIVFAWDVNESEGPPAREHGRDDGYRGRGRGGGGRGGRGNRGRGSKSMYEDEYEHRGGRGGGRGRYEDDYGGNTRGGGRGGYGPGPDRYDGGRSNGGSNEWYGPNSGGGSSSYGYNAPPPPAPIPPVAAAPPAVVPPPPAMTPLSSNQPQSEGDRLEQARKVQQLLAALKGPQAQNSPGLAPTTPAAPPATGGGGITMPPSGSLSIYPGSMPQQSYPASYPPPAAQQAPLPSSSTPGLNSLPPNLMALLQQAQAAQGSAQAPAPQSQGYYYGA